MQLESRKLREKRQPPRVPWGLILFIRPPRAGPSTETGGGLVVARSGGQEGGERLLVSMALTLWMMRIFWNEMGVMVTQQWEVDTWTWYVNVGD